LFTPAIVPLLSVIKVTTTTALGGDERRMWLPFVHSDLTFDWSPTWSGRCPALRDLLRRRRGVRATRRPGCDRATSAASLRCTWGYQR